MRIQMRFTFLAILLFSYSVLACDKMDLKGALGTSDILVFDEQTVVEKLGDLGGKYKVYNYTAIFGQAKRAANRLIVLDTYNNMVGMYAIGKWAISISGNCIMFPFDEKIGNSICLQNGLLPKSAWVGGDNPEFYK
ncbi:MAG: hypothetical protein OIF51_19180 [Cellvibrionaceae bacterium]|nr:hypothetical protein [Cellvibrionaceae bacterium]